MKKLLIIVNALLISVVLISCGDVSDAPITEMVLVYEGDFIRGSNSDLEEAPEDVVHVDRFYIDIYEVSNYQYKYFADATNHNVPADWIDGDYEEGKDDYPVVQVSLMDAVDYCKWAGKRLPTEDEWEKASRGPYGNEYPWGSESANYILANYGGYFNIDSSTPVSDYPEGKSYYGVYNMAGNVWEWTADTYSRHEGNTDETASNYDETYNVIKGGAYNRLYPNYLRGAARLGQKPNNPTQTLGFRCGK